MKKFFKRLITKMARGYESYAHRRVEQYVKTRYPKSTADVENFLKQYYYGHK